MCRLRNFKLSTIQICVFYLKLCDWFSNTVLSAICIGIFWSDDIQPSIISLFGPCQIIQIYNRQIACVSQMKCAQQSQEVAPHLIEITSMYPASSWFVEYRIFCPRCNCASEWWGSVITHPCTKNEVGAWMNHYIKHRKVCILWV